MRFRFIEKFFFLKTAFLYFNLKAVTYTETRRSEPKRTNCLENVDISAMSRWPDCSGTTGRGLELFSLTASRPTNESPTFSRKAFPGFVKIFLSLLISSSAFFVDIILSSFSSTALDSSHLFSCLLVSASAPASLGLASTKCTVPVSGLMAQLERVWAASFWLTPTSEIPLTSMMWSLTRMRPSLPARESSTTFLT